ncbi:MAG: TonB C-terminal domain-containing protein [Candidatus Theseobacter exili]|nr:TonB C-terminal domain-containing protein [Candidatus Theseobacter exili]
MGINKALNPLKIRFGIAFILSIAVHLTAVVSLQNTSKPFVPVIIKPPALKLDFVAAPSNAIKKSPPPETTKISDMDTLASDMNESKSADKSPNLDGETDNSSIKDPFSPQKEETSILPEPQESIAELSSKEDDTKKQEKNDSIKIAVQEEDKDIAVKETSEPEPEQKIEKEISHTPSEALPSTQGLGTISEKRPLSNAEALAEASYNARSTEIGKYMKSALQTISNQWQLSLLYSQTSVNATKTVVLFQILQSGEISDIRVIYHNGDIISQRYPLNAIEKASPLPPIPEEVLINLRKKGLWFKIEFKYE